MKWKSEEIDDIWCSINWNILVWWGSPIISCYYILKTRHLFLIKKISFLPGFLYLENNSNLSNVKYMAKMNVIFGDFWYCWSIYVQGHHLTILWSTILFDAPLIFTIKSPKIRFIFAKYFTFNKFELFSRYKNPRRQLIFLIRNRWPVFRM